MLEINLNVVVIWLYTLLSPHFQHCIFSCFLKGPDILGLVPQIFQEESTTVIRQNVENRVKG